MDILNAKNYGDILSTEEYLIDKENNNIISNFTYIGNNKVSNFIDGKFKINADLYSDENGRRYYTTIEAKLKNKDKIVNIDFKTSQILSIDKYLSYVDKMIDKDNILPAKVYRYENSTNKTETDYIINITYNGSDISIGPINKDSEVLVDRNKAIVSCNNIISEIYIFHINGYRILEIAEDGNINSFSDIVFTSSNICKEARLSNFIKNTSILSNIPDLSIIAMLYNNSLNLKYDEFGIMNDEMNNTLYEYCYFEDGNIDTIMSLHPLYYDMSDSSINCNDNIYCLEQLEYNYDIRFTRYSKQIYEINKDKINILKEDIKSAQNSDHPVLEMI